MNRETFVQTVSAVFDALDNHVFLPGEGISVPVLEKPLVGFAGAGDPLFEEFKEPYIIGPEFMTPKEWLEDAGTAVSFFFPFTEEIRKRAGADEAPVSETWYLGYKEKDRIVESFLDGLVSALEREDIHYVIPTRDRERMKLRPETIVVNGVEDLHFSVSWSNRHLLYAAGMGTFGINRHIITEKGCAGTLASIIISAEIEPDERTYDDPYAWCTRCGACVKRCRAEAITLENYRNLKICSAYSRTLGEQYGPGGCGNRCLMGVPCESRKPV
ncbi:MAG: hypothetical protein IJL98_00175 [Lachnospiraceae bacterium]|nr:hypothetical protein [Lachnospiraceae bacterium]